MMIVCILSTALAFLSAATLIQGECLKTYDSGVGLVDQKIITDKHNSLRLLLANDPAQSGQPRACNMKRLQYDANLAAEAQKIADTCNFNHVTVKDPRWGWVGQNLYMSMSTANTKGASWDGAIQSWFDERKKYTYPNNPDSNTGHYTQVAWAETAYVGCGYKNFEASSGYKYRKLYVCNYGPGGNIAGQAPYKTGSGTHCGCQNLC